MDKILSIIIPTYNMEKYLHKCLKSLIIDEKELFEKLDVLIINDGSNDNSLSIAREYENNYPGVFRAIDKPNGNYGSCVNRGLSEAKGKYVKILDADDSFATNGLTNIIRTLCEIEVDLVVTDYQIVTEDCKVVKTILFGFPKGEVIELQEAISRFPALQMHAVTYRLENLKAIEYKQTEGISYTDQEWVFLPLTRVKTMYYLDCVVYKYLVGRTGQTVDLGIYHRKVTDRVKMVSNLIENYEKYLSGSETSQYDTFLTQRLIELIHSIYLSYIIVNRDLQGAIEFDTVLQNSSSKLYNLLLHQTVHKFLPLRYISYVRENRKLPNILYTRMYKFYRRIN